MKKVLRLLLIFFSAIFLLNKVESQTIIYSDNYQTNNVTCLLYTSPSPRDRTRSRMPSSA